MKASRGSWSRLLLALGVALVPLVGAAAGPAAAHSPISSIVLTVAPAQQRLELSASIRYPDHDPVKGETVVAVAYSPDTREVAPLALAEDPSVAGRWSGPLDLQPGRWQVEVDAIRKTKGLQSIGFVVAADGSVSDVSSPAPLPATVAVPSAPAEGGGAGLRTAPRISATPNQVKWALLMGLVGCVVMVILVRRVTSEAKPAEDIGG